MDPFEHVELQDCPICHGPALGQEEGGWCVYVECMDCGCHTGEYPYGKEQSLEKAVEQAALMWNVGKVISHTPGE